MATLEKVKQMQAQGVPEDQIVQTLQSQGVPYREISEALSQNKIKAAVESSEDQNSQIREVPQENYQQQEYQPPAPSSQRSGKVQEISAPSPGQGNMQGMQQSIMSQSQENYEDYPQENYSQDYSQYNEQEQQYPEYSQGYSDYQPYDYSNSGSGGISPDTITEISEQLISEKFSDVRKHLEKVMDFKNTFETKIEMLDEKVKRIEKILDTLNSAVLRKVGDYVTNVDDIKKEMIATQKSLSKLVPGIEFPKTTTRKKSSHSKKKTKKK